MKIFFQIVLVLKDRLDYKKQLINKSNSFWSIKPHWALVKLQ